MLPDEQSVNTRMYPSEIEKMNAIIEKEKIDKQQFLIKAFSRFNRLSKKEQNNYLKYLDYERIKTDVMSFRARYDFVDKLNAKAEKINLNRSRLLRMVVVSGIGNSDQ